MRHAAPSAPRVAQTTGPGSPVKEIFGYARAGSLADPTFGYQSWNFNLLSTVAYYGIHVNSQGVLVADSNWDIWNSSTLTGLVATAHAHGVKVVVVLRTGGWELCGALYGATVTASQIVPQVVAKGIDGINIDYEGQNAVCPNPNAGGVNYTNQTLVTKLAKVLRDALDAARPGYYLSIATYSASASANDGFFNIPDLNQYVDSFFVMAYDMDYGNSTQPPLSCSGPLGITCLSPVSPLANYFYNDTLSMSQYSAVVGSGKVILGQPYYGRVACVASPVEHATPIALLTPATYLDAIDVPSSPDVRPGTFTAHRGDTFDPAGADRWDTWYDDYYGCWREMYWPDAVQLGTRYDLVNQDNLRGVGFWTLDYGGGAQELWDSLQSHFVTCTNVTLNANPAPPQALGPMVTLTAAAGNCPTPQYQFWLKTPSMTTWNVIQPYSSKATYTWDSASLPVGPYQFVVWARDARGAGIIGGAFGRLDTLAVLDFNLTSTPPAPCSSVTTSFTPAAPQLSGTNITLSASANCTNPRYEFWILPPQTSTWRLVQPYSTNATLTWNTLGLAPGDYRFTVRARDGTSYGTFRNVLGTWDSYSMPTYTVTTQPCASVAAQPGPASPQLSATKVTVSATAAGCPGPLYQFWILAPGSTWRIAQAYSTSATYSWDTTGLPAGPYVVAVWARDTSSLGVSSGGLGAWDALTSFAYTLTTQPCAKITATPSVASPQLSATQVAVGAASTGCPSPLYQFWVLAPGSTWQIVQPYSATATYAWNTTGLAAGTYVIAAWVRDKSSVGLNSGGLGAWDALTSFTFTLTTRPCATASAQTTPAGTATVGTQVTVSASSSGCPGPLYQFWMLAPGGQTWQRVQAFSSSSTFSWTTTGAPAGSYMFIVWVRDASSVGTSGNSLGRWDAYAQFTYTLT